MKKFSALVLAILMVGTLAAGCAASTPAAATKAPTVTTAPAATAAATAAATTAKKKIVVGFAAKGLSDPFTSMEAAVYKDKAQKNFGDKIEFKLLDCEFNTNKQIEVLENFIAMGVDVIICQTDDPAAILPQVEKCKTKKIPFITDLVLDSDWSYTVEANPQEDGEMLGKYAVEHLKGVTNPVVLFMQGEVGNKHADAREKYCKEALTAAGIKVTATNTAAWFRDKAIALTENWIQVYKKIDMIICANDDMGLGAVQVLESAGRLKDTKVISVDALAEAVLSVKQGKLALTIGKDFFSGVDTTFQLAIDLVNGVDRSKDKIIKVPKDQISLENPTILQKWIDLHKSVGNWKE